MAITALAGPLSNFVLALVSLGIGSLLFHFGPANRPVAYLLLFLCQLSVLNVGLGLFNLIPIPPLDGSRGIPCPHCKRRRWQDSFSPESHRPRHLRQTEDWDILAGRELFRRKRVVLHSPSLP